MFSRSKQPARPAPLTAREAVAKSAAGEVTLIDIRDPSEIRATGAATGALRIPLSVLRMQADPASPEHHPALSTDKAVVLYCASGARAAMAQGMLQDMGYGEVHNIGGFGHWQQAGGAVTR